MFGLPPLLAHILELGVFALVSLTGLGVGLRVLGMLRVDGLLGFGERVVFGLGLGYGALGFAMLGMGVVGVIYAPVGLVALVVLGGVGVGPILREVKGIRARIRSAIDELRYWPNLFLLGVIVLCVGAALAKALVPVATQDDLMYHLALPKRYIEGHTVAFYPDSTYSLFPQLMEMLYTWGLLLGSDRLAVLFAVGVGLLGPAAAGLFARRFAYTNYELRITNYEHGRSTRSSPNYELAVWRALPLFVPAIFLSTPLVGYILRAANTDLAQASFDMLAVYAVVMGLGLGIRDQGSGVGERGSGFCGLLVLGGVCAGLAFSVKYYGFAVGLALGIGLVLALRNGDKRAWGGIAAYAVGGGALAAPWLARNVVEAGNPVWPLAGRVLGGSYWSAEASPEILLGKAPGLGLENLWGGIGYMWTTMTRPTLLIETQWHEVALGPLLLTSLLVLPFVRWTAAWKWVGYAAGAYWMLWAFVFSHTSARYLSTFFLLTALLGGYGLVYLASRAGGVTARRMAGGVLAIVLGFLGLQAAWSARLYLPTALALDKGAEEQFLAAYMEDYPMMKYIEANTPQDAVIYVWDGQPRGYRIPRRYVYARLVPLYTGFGMEPGEWRARLGELGITHVLVHTRDALAPGQEMGVDPSEEVGEEFGRRYFGGELFRVGGYVLYGVGD